jgi:hypothetical protein
VVGWRRAFKLIGVWMRQGWPYAMIFREHLPSWDHLLDTATAYGTGQMVPPEKGYDITQCIPLVTFFGVLSLGPC